MRRGSSQWYVVIKNLYVYSNYNNYNIIIINNCVILSTKMLVIK